MFIAEIFSIFSFEHFAILWQCYCDFMY